MENSDKKQGFQLGIHRVAVSRTKADYDQCLAELRNVILTTEQRGCSMASFYNKRYGTTPLTVTEEQRIAEVFARYGITDWQGTTEDINK